MHSDSRVLALFYIGYRITATLLNVMFSGLYIDLLEIRIGNTCLLNKIHLK